MATLQPAVPHFSASVAFKPDALQDLGIAGVAEILDSRLICIKIFAA